MISVNFSWRYSIRCSSESKLVFRKSLKKKIFRIPNIISSLINAIAQSILLSLDIILKPCRYKPTHSLKGNIVIWNTFFIFLRIEEFWWNKVSLTKSQNDGNEKGENGNFYLFNDLRNSIGESPVLALKNLVKYELSSKYKS